MANKRYLPEVVWLQSPLAKGLWASLGFALAYSFISRAIDTASYWQYLGGVVFIVLSIRLLISAFKK